MPGPTRLITGLLTAGALPLPSPAPAQAPAKVVLSETAAIRTALTRSAEDAKDVADAVLGLAKTRAEFFFNYRVGLTRLDKAAGRDLDEIRAILAGTPSSSQTAEVAR